MDDAVAGHVDSGVRREPVAGNVRDGDAAVLVQLGADEADRRIEEVRSRADAAEVRESNDQADGPKPAHAEVPDVVEEDDTGRAARVSGWAEEGADHDIGAARLVDAGGAEPIVFRAETHA